MAWFSNPIAFTRGPVTIITTLVYIIVIAAVIVSQTYVPSSPPNPTPIHGINLTEAWDDLQLLTSQYHPYNSRRNDVVHDWLVARIYAILKENKASAPDAYIFEDNHSNLSYQFPTGLPTSTPPVSVYFEGTNIITYIRGSEDDQSEWWKIGKGHAPDRNGVLVNAHYDSVSTGYGATDDGVGVTTILQLIRYYTTTGNEPYNGVVLLLNNGEEDFLNGATVFSQHPMSSFVSSFLNLEGAGAGGRAALFRSTDDEVTKAYAKSPYPFGTVISGDAFERGLVRSQTDYIIFNGRLGLRGLDVAFIEPRARYHTNQDDSRHTGKDSLWHMLSTAVATTKALTKGYIRVDSATSAMDEVTSSDAELPGHRAIWFDMFGLAFAVMRAHTFFALAVTVLVVSPLILLLTVILLTRLDKMYLFSASTRYHTADGDEKVPLKGWRGLFRFPIIFALSCAAPVALAYLIFKMNPYIAHSSEWAVWGMMASSFVCVAWFFCRSLDSVRPSALTRVYAMSWLFGAWWIILLAATVFEEQFHLAGGYFTLFYAVTLFFSTWLAYLELFSLPQKSKYLISKLGHDPHAVRSRTNSRPPTIRAEAEQVDDEAEGETEGEATESSSLLPKRSRANTKYHTTSVEGGDADADAEESVKASEGEPYNNEQEWSKSMWTWPWLVEFLVLIPINTILLGQLGTYLVSALHQTGTDGSSMFLVYISMAVLTIFIFSPLIPLLHRFTWHVPTFLALVLIGTVLYNLFAYPFSSQSRMKVSFVQELDLDNGTNTVSLIGVPNFVQEAVSYVPSAAGQNVNCTAADPKGERLKCSWSGSPPKVANSNSQFAIEKTFKGLVNFNATLIKNGSDISTAQFVVYGKNTRACKLLLDAPIHDFYVHGQSQIDKRFASEPLGADSKEIRLWSRKWDRAWTVDVAWSKEETGTRHLTGQVMCLWSDVNQRGVIPAFDEVLHFVPNWVAVTKARDGLVEGSKRFRV